VGSQSLNHFNQKEEEKLILELFRQEYDLFPKGKISNTESPDFMLRNSQKIATGIELTKLHGPGLNKQNSHFSRGDSSYIPPEPSYENIEYTIRAKEEKLYLYRRKKPDQIWLIITTDLTDSPVSYNIGNKLSNWKFQSEFNKVFLFELTGRKVFELI
jgi:hypothetical protein